MRERGLSVLLAGKDHMQISFSFENKPFEKCFFVYSIFMTVARLKGVLRGLKCPCSFVCKTLRTIVNLRGRFLVPWS